MKKLWWVVFAVVIRVLLSAFLYHPDVKTINQEVKFFSNGIAHAYENSLKQGVEMHYPPPIYLLLKAHQDWNRWMFSSNFDNWLKDGGVLQTVNHEGIFRDLLVMKLPMMLVDLLIGWMLVKGLDKGKKRLGLMLWLFNPVTLYAVYGIGNFDILAVGVLVLGWLMWNKNFKLFTYFLIGIAGGLKLFGLLLIPMLLTQRQTIKSRIGGIILSGAGFGLCFLPILNSKAALKSIFLSNLTSGIFQARINFSDTHFVSVFFVILFGLWYWLMVKKDEVSFAQIVFLTLAPVFALSHFHPQWMVWLMPFMIIMYVNAQIRGRLLLLIIVSYFGVVLLINDKFVAFGMLKAVNNGFDSLQSIRWVLDKLNFGAQIQSVMHSALSAFLFWGIWETCKSLKLEWSNPKWLLPRTVVFGLVGILGLGFVVSHLILAKYGVNIDHTIGNAILPIWIEEGMTVEQDFVPTKENPKCLEMKFKNVDKKFVGGLVVSWKQDGVVYVNERISGLLIGDDYNLMLEIPDGVKANSPVKVKLEVDNNPTQNIFGVMADQTLTGLRINGYDMNGGLGYTIYYNTGFKESLGESIRNIISKIF